MSSNNLGTGHLTQRQSILHFSKSLTLEWNISTVWQPSTSNLSVRGGKPLHHHSDFLLAAGSCHNTCRLMEAGLCCHLGEWLHCQPCSSSRALPGNFATNGKESAAISVYHTKRKTDLLWLVMSVCRWYQKIPFMSPKSSVLTTVCTHFHFIKNSLPEGTDLGNMGALFSCANPLALKMPLLC